MKATTIIQGRETSEEDIDFVRKLIKENPGLHRKGLSIDLAKHWNWRDVNGQLKDMACRSFMLKLHMIRFAMFKFVILTLSDSVNVIYKWL